MGPTAPSDTGGAMSPITVQGNSFVHRCIEMDLATWIAPQSYPFFAQVRMIMNASLRWAVQPDHFKIYVANCQLVHYLADRFLK